MTKKSANLNRFSLSSAQKTDAETVRGGHSSTPAKPTTSPALRLSKSSQSSVSSVTTPSAAGGAPSTTVEGMLQKGHQSMFATPAKQVGTGRMLFALSLLAVAAGLGTLTYVFVNVSQTRLAVTQYNSIVDRAKVQATGITARTISGVRTMATVVSHAAPDAADYPFVTIPSFEAIARDVLRTSAGGQLVYAPIVLEDQLSVFEDFAIEFFEERYGNESLQDPSFRGTDGLWIYDEQFNPITGVTTGQAGGPKNESFVTPVLQHSLFGDMRTLMFNLGTTSQRHNEIVDMLHCSEERSQLVGNLSQMDEQRCGAISGVLPLPGYPIDEYGPGIAVMQPVYPANNPDEMTGYVSAPLLFQESIKGVFGGTVNGIDCILKSNDTVYSYRVVNGEPMPIGFRDIHDPNQDHLEQVVHLGAHKFTSNSPTFDLCFYPNDDLWAVYQYISPMAATAGVILIVIFVTIIFLFYDMAVRKEFSAKTELLDARRRFVRFISHEVRTPLNAACIGLTLMQEKLAQAAGFEKADELTQLLELDGAPPPAGHHPTNDHSQSTDIERKGKGPCPIDSKSSPSAPVSNEKICDWFSLAQDVLLNAQSSVDVLNDFLNYDKIESGNLSLDLSVVSIFWLVESTVQEFKLSASKKKILYNLRFEQVNAEEGVDEEVGFRDGWKRIQQDLPSMAVIGDAVRLRQVLRNLLSNALKFTPPGESVTTIVKYCPPGLHETTRMDEFHLGDGGAEQMQYTGQIQVSVVDTGTGMTPPQVAKLFSDGIQFNPNNLQAGQGSGIGLFISKGIVKEHFGALEASSDGINKGSTFTLRLPLHTAGELVGIETTESAADESPQNAPPDHRRILVVDDILSNRKMMKRLLEHHRHECEVAEDGLDATKKALNATERGEPFDTILMDYEMPVMSGPVATAKIRDDGFSGYIIGVTGNMFPEDIQSFMESGANGVLSKPFKMDCLEGLWAENPNGLGPRKTSGSCLVAFHEESTP